ncbi:hypothetical protein QA584_11340 [Anaerocolumna sp. AGMB13025]|uniref:hypothetical protein n=1 Tax=Anaerocolumna sp. AGMB13025 TaxID=3039116 RepID=UPI00241FD801|nr:hypothetical protein [Anaerocolumna sp. AGMB13025]WFR59648.1 hypothetical protein QA584_11340 [Anaerocolumna sp. AGMB13025]
MKLIKRKIKVYGGKEIYILTPYAISPNITAGHDNKGFVLIWGNGSGYQFLTECFSIAAELHKDEILYLPVRYQVGKEFTDTFQGCECNYDIVCRNYCETQISIKEIEDILKIKSRTEEIIQRNPKINKEFIDRWKTNRRLTVKIHKRNMYISTNRDGFHSLTYGAMNLTEYGDVYIEDYLPHMHYDWSENTSSSIGINLYYWNDRKNK